MPETKDQHELMEAIKRVQAKYTDNLMGRANVVGVAIGLRQEGGEYTDEPVLVVLVSQKLPRAQLSEDDFVPREIDGVPVDIQEVGFLSASNADADLDE